jgi:AraC-like DNA-binding protein
MRIAQEHVTHPDRAFRLLRFELDAFRTQRHRHAELELTWIEAGAGVRFVGDSAAPFAPGDLVLLGPDVPHAWVSSHGGKGPAAATVLQFPLALLAQPLLPELQALRPLAERARLGLSVTGTCHEGVTRVLRRLPGADALGRLAGLVQVLQCLAAHPQDLRTIASSAMAGAADAGRRRRIDLVTDWVHRHLEGELNVHDAARVAHVSPAAFSRFFRRETGKTWSDYVNDVRCSEACVALRQSDKPVAHIALDCGYRTLSHFNRAFRTRLGVTPSAYRGT